jgi:outer membrane protein
MRTNLKTLLAIVLTGIIANAKAQQVDTSSYFFSVQQSVEFALKHNTAMQNVILDQQIATNKIKEIIGSGLPQINGSSQLQQFIEIPTSQLPGEIFGGPAGTFIPVKFGVPYTASAGFSITQLAFSGSYLIAIQGTKIYNEIAKKNIERTQLETSTEVTKAYYTVLVNNEKKKLLAINLDRIKKIVDDTKALNLNGFVEKIDVDRITVTYNNLSTEFGNISRLLDLSTVLLKYKMGMDQISTLTLTDKIENLGITTGIAENAKFDYSRRVEIQLYELAITGRKLMLKADRFGYMPTVAFFGSATAQAQRTKPNFFEAKAPWYPAAIVGLQINVPIFDGLQKNYKIQSDKIELLKSENDLLFMQRTIDMQQMVTKVNLQNSSASLQSQKDNMTLAQSVFDVAKTKYEQGFSSNLEVINAQTALKEAQTNYFNALYDTVIAKVEYDKSIGSFIK